MSDDSASKRGDGEKLEAEHGDSGNVIGCGNVVECSGSSDARAEVVDGEVGCCRGGKMEGGEGSLYVCGTRAEITQVQAAKLCSSARALGDKEKMRDCKRKVKVKKSVGVEGAWEPCFCTQGSEHPCHRLVCTERHCGRAKAIGLRSWDPMAPPEWP